MARHDDPPDSGAHVRKQIQDVIKLWESFAGSGWSMGNEEWYSRVQQLCSRTLALIENLAPRESSYYEQAEKIIEKGRNSAWRDYIEGGNSAASMMVGHLRNLDKDLQKGLLPTQRERVPETFESLITGGKELLKETGSDYSDPMKRSIGYAHDHSGWVLRVQKWCLGAKQFIEKEMGRQSDFYKDAEAFCASCHDPKTVWFEHKPGGTFLSHEVPAQVVHKKDTPLGQMINLLETAEVKPSQASENDESKLKRGEIQQVARQHAIAPDPLALKAQVIQWLRDGDTSDDREAADVLEQCEISVSETCYLDKGFGPNYYKLDPKQQAYTREITKELLPMKVVLCIRTPRRFHGVQNNPRYAQIVKRIDAALAICLQPKILERIIWLGGAIEQPAQGDNKQERAQERFTMPRGTTWSGIVMRFADGHTVNISAPGMKKPKRYTYVEMGFKDERSANPNQAWIDLETIVAKSHGTLTATKHRKKRLSDRLKAFFDLTDDPFHPFRKNQGWVARFKIHPEGCTCTDSFSD